MTQAVGIKAGLRVSLSNWHREIPEGMPNITVVKTDVGFSGEGYIVVSGIKRGQKIIIIDELLSTGGTLISLIKAAKESGAIITGAFFLGEKVNKGGRERIAKEFPDVKIKSIVKFIGEAENKVTIDADI